MGRETAIALAVSEDKSISKDCCLLDCDALHSCYCGNLKSHKSTSMQFHSQTSVSIKNGRYPTLCNTWKKLIRHNNAYNITTYCPTTEPWTGYRITFEKWSGPTFMWDFHAGDYEEYSFLECHVMWSTIFWGVYWYFRGTSCLLP